MSKGKFRTSKEAKAAGWFSRRNETSKENLESRKTLRERAKTRKERAQIRQEEHDKLPLEEKLKRALENGHEGTREVKRLRKQLNDRS